MSYRDIPWQQLKHPRICEVMKHANMYLSDVYGMFHLPLKGVNGGGGCNFSIVLVLLCVLDGISRDVYPTRLVKDHEKRFKKLIRDKLYWSDQNKDWIDKGEAASLFYLELRNPLVHNLGQDTVSRTRREGFNEPVIGKWGKMEARKQNIADIDESSVWDNNYPTLYVESTNNGNHMKLCAAALYWSVKQMISNLITSDAAIQYAEVCQNAISTLESE